MADTHNEEGAAPRGLFGGRRAAVERLLNDRELVLRETRGRLQAAEERIAQLERELEEARDQVAAATERRSTALPPDAPGPSGAPSTPPRASLAASFINDELGSILHAAEAAARNIVERAEAESVEELAAARHVWEELQEQVTRYGAWRVRAEPAISAAHDRVAEIHERSLQVADQIRDSIRALTDQLGTMDADLREVMRLPSPPPLTPPAEFGLAEQVGLGAGAGTRPALSAAEWVPAVGSRHLQRDEDVSPLVDETDADEAVADETDAETAADDDVDEQPEDLS